MKDVKPSIANYILKEQGFVLITEANLDSINEKIGPYNNIDLDNVGTNFAKKTFFYR